MSNKHENDMNDKTAKVSVTNISHIIDNMYRKFIKPEDQVLLNTVFAPEPTQEMLDECLRACDIEVMGAHKTLLLSYLMLEHPYLSLSDYAGPRVNGLIHFYRFANIRVLAHFSRIGKALNVAGIPILLFKGAAIKALRPEFSRPMADVDFLVPNERFLQACGICEKLGYRKVYPEKDAGDFMAPDGSDAIDIHRRVLKSLEGSDASHASFHAALLGRAQPDRVFGVQLLMPVREDLFTIVALNLEKNLREGSSVHSQYFSICDCRFLLTGAFNWDIVRKNVQITNSAYQFRLAAAFINTLAPGTIPEEKLEKYFPWTMVMKEKRKLIKYENKCTIQRIINERAEVCRYIPIVELRRHPRYVFYRIFKLLLLRKLRNFPFLVRWYLKSRGHEVYRAD